MRGTTTQYQWSNLQSDKNKLSMCVVCMGIRFISFLSFLLYVQQSVRCSALEMLPRLEFACNLVCRVALNVELGVISDKYVDRAVTALPHPLL